MESCLILRHLQLRHLLVENRANGQLDLMPREVFLQRKTQSAKKGFIIVLPHCLISLTMMECL